MYRWGEVIAIEAQERIFYALAGNISLNNCFNARAIWAALGESVGTIGIPQPNYLQPSSFGSLEMRRHKNNEFIGQVIDYENLNPTKMISVDSLNLKRLDFLKLDIEGMEIEGLRGATESLKTFKPQLLVEKIKSNSGEIEDLLAGLGYKLFNVGINLLCVHASDPVASVISVS
jgi:FkbM family methyltransferase